MQPKCKHCGSDHVMRRGLKPKPKYQCMDCGHYFHEEVSPAKFLILDIETLPGWKRFWRLGEEDWNIDSIVFDWILLSFSYKYLFDDEVFSVILTPTEIKRRDDRRLVKMLWKLLDGADIVLAHNGDRFDIPKINSRFIEEGYTPPSPYLTIDTRQQAAKQFGWTSNKQDFISLKLGTARKMQTDYGLWIKCEQGDQEALDYMAEYNKGDVLGLEENYIIMRPWIKHPNMGLYMVLGENDHVCPHCGGTVKWEKVHRTPARAYRACHCTNCGAWGRDFKSYLTTTTTRVRI